MHMMKDQLFCLRTFLSCILLTGIYAAGAYAQPVELRSGLLADNTQATLYSMHPEGGIEAINALDGSQRWHSANAQRPVLLEQGRLLAQGDAAERENELNMVLLDTASGVAIASRFIDLPEGVVAAVDDGLGARFAVNSVSDEFVSWQSEQRLVQGAFLENEQPSLTQQSGALRVDLQAGIVATAGLNELPPVQPRIINVLPAERLALGNSRQFVSADRNHILVSERTNTDPLNVYQWGVHTTDGTILGSLPARTSRSDFVVLDDAIMVYVAEPFVAREGGVLVSHPLRMIAVELTSGDKLWERPLRDTRYNGPFPP